MDEKKQMTKQLYIECVNRVKLEKVEEFCSSIFEDVYVAAHMQIGRIISKDSEQTPDDAEKFCNGDEMNNVVSFVGERGMGKSSAMLSFAYFLSGYPNNLKCEAAQEFKFAEEELRFYTLPKIDAGNLSHESIFDVILTKMWTDFNGEEQRDGDIGFECIKNNFNSIKDSYNRYYKEEKDNRNLASVRQLSNLARGLSLRQNFAELVSSFLGYMVKNANIKLSDRYLVIPIDDLDLANDNTLAILEQLRAFLIVPHVIILITVNIEKLLMHSNKEFSEKLICGDNIEADEKKNIRQYAEQYIAKSLPRNNRIYMPGYNGFDVLKYTLDHEKYVSAITEKEVGGEVHYFLFVNMAIANHLNILLNYEEDMIVQTESLRNIVNKLNELWVICRYKETTKEQLLYEWLEKDITISLNQLTSRQDISFMRELEGISENDYNACIIDYITKQLQKAKENKIASRTDRRKRLKKLEECGYGQVLCTLLKYKDQNFQNKQFIKELSLLYSVRISKCLQKQGADMLEHVFIKDDIWASAFDEWVFGYEWKPMALDALLRLRLEYQEKKAADMMEKNAEKLVGIFKALLFCDMEKLMEKTVYEVGAESESMKEVPLAGSQGEPAEEKAAGAAPIIEFKTTGVTARVSLDYFFRNIIRYGDLFESYAEWIYKQLADWTGEQAPTEEKPWKKGTLESAWDDAKKIDEKIKEFEIKNVYDILPVQDVNVMLRVLSDGARLREEKNIAAVMRELTRIFVEQFRRAEEGCFYGQMGNRSYAEN